jgi:hypothetical protein
LLEQVEKAKKTPPVATPQTPNPEAPGSVTIDDLLSEEEKRELEQYDADFDTVSKMEALKRKRDLAEFRKEMKELRETFQTGIERMAPVFKDIEKRTEEEHFSTIRNAHSDFHVYRDNGQINAWIEKKPAYVREALIKTCKEGRAEDVIDLISDFKAENNIAPVDPPSGKVVDINSKREQKRQALSAVTSRGSAVRQGGHVAAGYEDAFEEAAAKQ